MPTTGSPGITGSAAKKDLIVAAIAATAILGVGLYASLQKPGANTFRSYPSATGVALPAGSNPCSVDHSIMVGAANQSGVPSAPCYRWRNSATGEVKATNSPTGPGPAWASY